jgi:hypothetical protein
MFRLKYSRRFRKSPPGTSQTSSTSDASDVTTSTGKQEKTAQAGRKRKQGMLVHNQVQIQSSKCLTLSANQVCLSRLQFICIVFFLSFDSLEGLRVGNQVSYDSEIKNI